MPGSERELRNLSEAMAEEAWTVNSPESLSLLAQAQKLNNELVEHERKDSFDELGAEIHETNVEKGFWGPPVAMDQYAAKLALIHSEVTEVLEALRKSQGADKVTEEFADVLIRTFDLYNVLVQQGEADPRLYAVMKEKMKNNKERPPKHGNRWG